MTYFLHVSFLISLFHLFVRLSRYQIMSKITPKLILIIKMTIKISEKLNLICSWFFQALHIFPLLATNYNVERLLKIFQNCLVYKQNIHNSRCNTLQKYDNCIPSNCGKKMNGHNFRLNLFKHNTVTNDVEIRLRETPVTCPEVVLSVCVKTNGCTFFRCNKQGCRYDLYGLKQFRNYEAIYS